MVLLPEIVNGHPHLPDDGARGAGPAPICSARGCRMPAKHVLRWRNPRLHTGDRQKAWAACDEHLASLSAFLDARSFLLGTESYRG